MYILKTKIEQRHIAAIIMGILVLIVDLIMFLHSTWFIPLIVISVTLGWSQFWIDYFVRVKEQKELESRFPEFVRNLVSSIQSGMPVSRSIIQASKTDYGSLTPFVVKLANQVEWAIPVHKALLNFANETDNGVIKRSIATVIEAERSGGNMADVLETITTSVIEIKRIKLERRASIHSQLVQSYIIFIVFLGVMIVIQNLLIPYISEIGAGDMSSGGLVGATDTAETNALSGVLQKVEVDYSTFSSFFVSVGSWFTSIRGVFLLLACIQALFAGLVLGKLAEGDFKAGAKHSFILLTIAFFVISLAQGVI